MNIRLSDGVLCDCGGEATNKNNGYKPLKHIWKICIKVQIIPEFS